MPNSSLAMQIPSWFGSAGGTGSVGSMGPPPARFPPSVSTRTPAQAAGAAAPWSGPDWPANSGSVARSHGGGHSLGSYSLYGRSVDMMDVVNNMIDAGGVFQISSLEIDTFYCC